MERADAWVISHIKALVAKQEDIILQYAHEKRAEIDAHLARYQAEQEAAARRRAENLTKRLLGNI